MSTETQLQQDMVFLMGRPEFRRTLFRIIEAAGILRSAYGSEDRNLQGMEGRRSLGFDILRWADEALPAGAHPSGISVFPLLNTLREEAQPQEDTNGRSRNSAAGNRDRGGNDRDRDVDDGADDFDRR